MAMNTNAIKASAAKVAATAPTKEEQRARAVKPPSQVVNELLGRYSGMIREALGKAMDPERFTRLLVTVIAQDPNLLRAVAECPASLIGAILTAATLGLEPNTALGHGYLITYFQKNKAKSQEAGRDIYEMRVSFQLGYQGILVLAYRSGDIADVDAQVVYEKDQFKYQLGTNRFINHVPSEDADPGRPVRYYAVIQLKSGGQLFKVWSASQVLEHAKKFSKSYNARTGRFFGPWEDNFSAMAKKTVLLDCLKLAPKSSSFSAQIAADNTTKSITADAAHVDILNQRNEDYTLVGESAEREALPAPEEAKAEPERERETVKAKPEQKVEQGNLSVDEVI